MTYNSEIIEACNHIFNKRKKKIILYVPWSGSSIVAALVMFGSRLSAYSKAGIISKAATENIKPNAGLNGLNIVSIIVLAATLTNVALSIYTRIEIGFVGYLFRAYFLTVSLAGVLGKADFKDVAATSFFLRVLNVWAGRVDGK